VPEPVGPEPKTVAPPAPKPEAVASAEHDAVPLPPRNPAAAEATKESEKPKKPSHPSEFASSDWTQPQILGGRAACTKMLAQVVASYEAADPIREGMCGAPAPIRLSTINAAPRVEIRPSALVTCAMAVQLAHWMAQTVQPAARKHLGEEIVAIRNVASYSCRNRYNASNTRISEHALVNALDIAAFETASGKTVTLLQHWHAKEQKQVSESQARKARDRSDGEAAEAVREEDDKPRVSPASAKRLISAAEAATKENPPPPEPKPEKPKAPELVPAPEANFLHAAFDGACKTFGTVLGPESNAAHRDHFHLDMKERSYGGYCE